MNLPEHTASRKGCSAVHYSELFLNLATVFPLLVSSRKSPLILYPSAERSIATNFCSRLPAGIGARHHRHVAGVEMKPAMIVGEGSQIAVAPCRAGNATAFGTESQRHRLLGRGDDDILTVELNELPLRVGQRRKRFVGSRTLRPGVGFGFGRAQASGASSSARLLAEGASGNGASGSARLRASGAGGAVGSGAAGCATAGARPARRRFGFRTAAFAAGSRLRGGWSSLEVGAGRRWVSVAGRALSGAGADWMARCGALFPRERVRSVLAASLRRSRFCGGAGADSVTGRCRAFGAVRRSPTALLIRRLRSLPQARCRRSRAVAGG